MPEPHPPRCPVCDHPMQPRHRPFCSRHCAAIDLGRWLTGQYRIPDVAEEEADADRLAGMPSRA